MAPSPKKELADLLGIDDDDIDLTPEARTFLDDARLTFKREEERWAIALAAGSAESFPQYREGVGRYRQCQRMRRILDKLVAKHRRTEVI